MSLPQPTSQNKLPIDAIRVGKRYRHDLGDLTDLATSIEQIGLLHPIVVNESHDLIAGARRLAACRSLGWQEVPVNVLPLKKIVRGEYAENAYRLDLPPSDTVAIWRAVLPLEQDAARKRQEVTRVKPGENVALQGVEKFSTPTGRAKDQVANLAGVSRWTLEKATAIVEAAEKDPERYAPLVERMDTTGKVDAVFRELHRRERETALIERGDQPLPDGPFDLILADPPWRYEQSQSDGRRVEEHYPTMTLDAIKAMPVSRLAAPDSILYLWGTSPKLTEALEVMSAWGYTYRTCMVWVKQRIGCGFYCRQQHELLLIGVRGTPVLPDASKLPSSVMQAPRREHSEKPVEVYEMLERLYPGRQKCELFARSVRPGWVAWGNDARLQNETG